MFTFKRAVFSNSNVKSWFAIVIDIDHHDVAFNVDCLIFKCTIFWKPPNNTILSSIFDFQNFDFHAHATSDFPFEISPQP